MITYPVLERSVAAAGQKHAWPNRRFRTGTLDSKPAAAANVARPPSLLLRTCGSAGRRLFGCLNGKL